MMGQNNNRKKKIKKSTKINIKDKIQMLSGFRWIKCRSPERGPPGFAEFMEKAL